MKKFHTHHKWYEWLRWQVLTVRQRSPQGPTSWQRQCYGGPWQQWLPTKELCCAGGYNTVHRLEHHSSPLAGGYSTVHRLQHHYNTVHRLQHHYSTVCRLQHHSSPLAGLTVRRLYPKASPTRFNSTKPLSPPKHIMQHIFKTTAQGMVMMDAAKPVHARVHTHTHTHTLTLSLWSTLINGTLHHQHNFTICDIPHITSWQHV
jgi:hypothetical protein